MARKRCALLMIAVVLFATCQSSRAINVTLNYDFDTQGFFNPSTTNGLQARNTLQAVADFYSGILDDTFTAVTIPEPLVGIESTFSWTLNFVSPSTGGSEAITSGGVVVDEYRIYVGGRSFGGNTLGSGGPGVWARNLIGTGALFGDEIAEFNAKQASFEPDVITRGEPESEFAAWGGSVSFDNDGSTNWNFNHNVEPSGGQSDLFSVALHEIGHVLGLGGSEQWTDLVRAGRFTGAAVTAENGGTPPPADDDHWQEGLTSTVFGGFTSQETLLDPTITTGTRKVLTRLDAAALTDIGWDVNSPSLLAGDYNFDGTVDAADYTVWRDSLGTGAVIGSYNGWRGNFGATTPVAPVPEPSGAILCFVAVMAGVSSRRSRR